MSDFMKPKKSIWKLSDGKIWEGDFADLPKSGASLVAKAGKEYPTAWLKEQGWGEKKKKPLLRKKSCSKEKSRK